MLKEVDHEPTLKACLKRERLYISGHQLANNINIISIYYIPSRIEGDWFVQRGSVLRWFWCAHLTSRGAQTREIKMHLLHTSGCACNLKIQVLEFFPPKETMVTGIFQQLKILQLMITNKNWTKYVLKIFSKALKTDKVVINHQDQSREKMEILRSVKGHVGTGAFVIGKGRIEQMSCAFWVSQKVREQKLKSRSCQEWKF